MNLTQIYTSRQITGEQLQVAITEVENQLNKLAKRVPLSEDGHAMSSEIAANLVKAQTKLAAAKRGLGIVNKLSVGDSKVKHAKRVMANVNKLRAEVQRLQKMLKQHETAEDTVKGDK